MNPQDIESYIAVRVGMLTTVYGAKENPARAEVFVRHLRTVPLQALKKAFDKAEICFEKMPTPKKLGELCGEFLPSEAWRYNFQPGTDQQGVPCLTDPDPDCDACRKPRSKHPTETCAVVVDKLRARYMYKPRDCEEGRVFLARLKEIAFSSKRRWRSA